jgi:hypothetical protein
MVHGIQAFYDFLIAKDRPGKTGRTKFRKDVGSTTNKSNISVGGEPLFYLRLASNHQV